MQTNLFAQVRDAVQTVFRLSDFVNSGPPIYTAEGLRWLLEWLHIIRGRFNLVEGETSTAIELLLMDTNEFELTLHAIRYSFALVPDDPLLGQNGKIQVLKEIGTVALVPIEDMQRVALTASQLVTLAATARQWFTLRL